LIVKVEQPTEAQVNSVSLFKHWQNCSVRRI
jgi:hypothetical protein